MIRKLHGGARDDKGFTLIELLVVILLIGILAAIALPAFLNQRQKAQDAEAKTAARTAQTAEETYYTDNQKYTEDVDDLREIEPALNEGVAAGPNLQVGFVGSDEQTYEVTVNQPKTTSTFSIRRDTDGHVTRTCTTVASKGCPTNGSW